MESNSARGESCRGQIIAYLISPGCISVWFLEDKDRPRGDQKYLSSVARVHKYFRTCCLSSDSTCMVHDRPPINSHWSRNFLEGISQYERLNKIFNEVVQTHRYEFECLGISVEYFRTHSIRKGAATFLATGCTVSPPMASTWLHTNWKLGGVKYR